MQIVAAVQILDIKVYFRKGSPSEFKASSSQSLKGARARSRELGNGGSATAAKLLDQPHTSSTKYSFIHSSLSSVNRKIRLVDVFPLCH
jgi:Ulp1 family protease